MPEQIIKTPDGQVCSTISEVNATLLYDVGLNAKQQMLQDSYLMDFVPTISDSILEKHGIKSIMQVQAAIEKDTSLLERLTEDAINEKKDEWRQEVTFAEEIRQKANNLFYILQRRSAFTKRPAAKTPAVIEDLRHKLEASDRDIANRQQMLQNPDLPQDARQRLEEALDNAKVYKTRLEGELTAFDEPLPGADQGAAEGVYAPYTHYITNVIKNDREIFEGKAAEYLEKYGCVPKFLSSYLEMLDFAENSVYAPEIDTLDLKKTLTMGINQYTDILTEGPKLIYATAKLYPEYQKAYDNETDIYYRTEEEQAAGEAKAIAKTKALSQDQDEPVGMGEAINVLGDNEKDFFKSKYRLNGLLFSNILAHPFKTVEDVQDRRVPAIFGPPGIGKTAGVEATIKKIDGVVKDFFGRTFSVPHMDSSQFSGPMAVNENDEAMQFMPSGMKPLVNKPGLCLFDEATAANDPAVHNQLATVTQKGTLTEGIKMHPLMLMVFAGNDDPNDNANVEALSHVEKTRLQIMYMLDPKSIMVGWQNYITHEPGIMNNKYRAAAASFIISFLNTKEGRQYRLTKSTERGRGISPNLRTWTNFIKDLEPLFASESFNSRKMREAGRAQIIAAGSKIVGAKAATELADYYIKYVNLTPIDDMIKMSRKFGVLDAIRVYDSTNRSGDLAGGNTSIYAETDHETGKKKFVIDSPRDCDVDLTDAMNRVYMKQLKQKMGAKADSIKFDEKHPSYATPEKSLLSKKDFEDAYNKLWPCEEINSAAAIAYYKNSIKSYFESLFDTANKTHKPVDGAKLDDIMKLAMLIPQKAFRQEVTIDIINGMLNPDKINIFKKYGVSYKDKEGKETVIYANPDPNKPLEANQRRDIRLNKMSRYALSLSRGIHEMMLEKKAEHEMETAKFKGKGKKNEAKEQEQSR